MNTRTISPGINFYFILVSLFSTFLITPLYAAETDDSAESDDRSDYGYMGMGHMRGYMGSGHMGNYMGHHMGPGYMGEHMGSGHMGMGFNFMHMLDLSDKQRKSIREIHKATRTQQLSYQDKLAEHSDELYTLYKADKPDAKKISAIYKKIFDIKREQIELNISTRNKAFDVLTKEQKEQIKESKSSGMGFSPYHMDKGRGMHNMMK